MFQHYKQEWNFPWVVIFIYMESRRKHDKNMYHKKRLINHVKWLKNNKTKGHGITKLKWGYSRLKIIRCLVKQTWIRHRNFTHININTLPSWISRFVCLRLISAHVWLASFWSAHKTNHPTQQEKTNRSFIENVAKSTFSYILSVCHVLRNDFEIVVFFHILYCQW